MLGFLLPLASKVISDAVAKMPETDMDDQLLEAVAKAIRNREE